MIKIRYINRCRTVPSGSWKGSSGRRTSPSLCQFPFRKRLWPISRSIFLQSSIQHPQSTIDSSNTPKDPRPSLKLRTIHPAFLNFRSLSRLQPGVVGACGKAQLLQLKSNVMAVLPCSAVDNATASGFWLFIFPVRAFKGDKRWSN